MDTFPDSKAKYSSSDNKDRNDSYDPESQVVRDKFDGPPALPP